MYRSRRKIVVLWIFVLSIVALFIFLSQYSLVIVSSSSESELEVYQAKAGESVFNKGRLGVQFIPSGKYIFEVNSSNSQTTRKTADVHSFWINKVNLPLNNQKQLKRIASDTKDCVYGTESEINGSIVYSYDCPRFLEPALSANNNQPSRELTTNLNLYDSKPYKDGVIGLEEVVDFGEEENFTPRIRVVYVTGTKAKKVEIDGLAFRTNDSTKIAISGTRVFVLDQETNKLAVFDDFPSSDVNVIDIQTSDLTGRFVSLSALDSQLFAYFIGVPQGDGEGIASGAIRVFDFSSEQVQESEIIVKDKKILREYLFELTPLENNLFASWSREFGGSIIIFEIADSSISIKDILAESNRVAYSDGLIYIESNDGKLFSYDHKNKVQSLVFGSDHTIINRIEAITAGLIIKATTSQFNTEHSMTYLLSSNDWTGSSVRLEDFLPYTHLDNEIPTILFDQAENSISVKISGYAETIYSRDDIQNIINDFIKDNRIDTSTVKIKID